MKRNHGYVSSTPLFLQKKGRTSSRQHGLLGTPVEGLTSIPIDTPDSDDRPQRVIPDTTQRRLEGFCLNTPLTLSQAAQQETPTLGKDQPAQHEDPQHQQRQQHHDHMHSSLKQQPPLHLGPAGLTQGRHRLANISNLPPSPALGLAGTAAAGCSSPQQPHSSYGAQPMATAGITGRQKKSHHVFFQPGLTSPQASLTAPSSGSRTGANSAVAAAAGAGAARTPYPSTHCSSSLAGTPGSCAGGDDDDGGFVLFTSQSYVRQSQPVISPNFAAGLSSGPEEEPTTTPSQDSREPRQSPSHATTTTGSVSFDLAEPLQAAAEASAGAAHPCSSSGAQEQQQEHVGQEVLYQPTASQMTAPNAEAQGAAAAAGNGSTTPGDGLGLLLHGGADLEETTTPELEQIGILASQECGSQQQQQQQQLLSSAPGAAAAAAAAGGFGSRAGIANSSRGRGGSGERGSRGLRGPGVVCEEVTAKQMLFPVFRPLKERKCVILVRHGESTYNKQDAHGKAWADPKIFDAPLTQRGRQQAVAARERVTDMLKKHGHLGNTLWLCSPLTRALETMTLAAPQVEQLAGAQQGVGASKVVISSLIAEHCATSGDVGRPASELRGKFPGLTAAMDDLQEVWWHNPAPEENPNCALTGVFNKAESIESMRRRVSEFASWLRHRPEHVVVAFGHSTFWKYFANSRVRLRNCEVMQMWW